ncbi:unnamed protein product [Gordionus sp. m RMFG-2023]
MSKHNDSISDGQWASPMAAEWTSPKMTVSHPLSRGTVMMVTGGNVVQQQEQQVTNSRIGQRRQEVICLVQNDICDVIRREDIVMDESSK